MKNLIQSLIAGSLVVLSAVGSSAADRPLPAFQVVALTGQRVGSADVADTGNWLIVYTRPQCAACDQVLRLLVPADTGPQPAIPPQSLARVRIVVGGAAAPAVNALRQRYPALADARWYGDPSSDMAAALALHGAPAVFGMHDLHIAWTSQGALPITRSAMAEWLNR